MNNGQSSSSPAIRLFTDERVLAGFRLFSTASLGIIVFFVLRFVSVQDETNRQMEAFRASIQAQISDFKIDVARNTSTNNAMIAAIQNRLDAQSSRMDGMGSDIREVNKKLYEARVPR